MTAVIHDLVIAGKVRPASDGATLAVRDPATGEVMAEVADASPADVAEALAAARQTQPLWAALAPRERGSILHALASLIRRDADHLTDLESRDTGKPLRQARGDVEVAAEYFEFYAGYADKLYGDTIPLGGDRIALSTKEPRGVTAHIIPWNYPLQIGSRTIAPSLMAGNACVLKPAEEAPLAALALGVLALEAGLPPGLVNVVPGRGETVGAALAQSNEIDHLSFTGGLETGRIVMAAAARNITPLTLELGGKSPSVVLADADLGQAIPTIVRALVQNAGQTCSAGTRVIIEDSVFEEVVEALAAQMSALTIGHGSLDPDMGPLISEAQRDKVLGYMQIGQAEGARVVTGGRAAEVPGCENGYFVRPTLFDTAQPNMRIAQEEIFGPVLCALRFSAVSEAVAIANGTDFGLVASVWTRDLDRAMWCARRISAGQVYINSYGAGGGVALPFGGTKLSGFGREKGLEAVNEYTQTKVVVFDPRSQV